MRTVITQTDGRGYWSKIQKQVLISHAVLTSLDSESAHWMDADFAELRAVFDPQEWDTIEHGLIYTDKTWLKIWRLRLQEMGFTPAATNDISYSEMGMQGKNFVSMDVGPYFIRECDPLLRFTEGTDPIADFLIIDP